MEEMDGTVCFSCFRFAAASKYSARLGRVPFPTWPRTICKDHTIDGALECAADLHRRPAVWPLSRYLV